MEPGSRSRQAIRNWGEISKQIANLPKGPDGACENPSLRDELIEERETQRKIINAGTPYQGETIVSL